MSKSYLFGVLDWSPKQQQKKQDDKQTQKTKLRQVDIPYIRGLSEKLQATFKKYNIGVIHKPFNTIRSSLVKPKDKTDKLNMCGAIYEIKCPTCNECYVGETARNIKTRFKEHVRLIGPLTAVGEHCQNTGHKITEENIKVIGRESSLWKRKIREAIEIMQRQPTLNRDTGYYMPPIYNTLFKLPQTTRGSCDSRPSSFAE